MEMESNLTELEMGAVFQLIQLRGGYADDFRVFWVNFPPEKDKSAGHEASSSSSSSLIDEENCTADEALPRRKARFGSLVDIYRKTQPLIKNRAKNKRARF